MEEGQDFVEAKDRTRAAEATAFELTKQSEFWLRGVLRVLVADFLEPSQQCR
jgi:hypothetical protein